MTIGEAMSPHKELADLELSAQEVMIGARRLRLWRPARPQELVDGGAESGAAGPVWAHTWTSGIVLARLITDRALQDLRVLDIGCGLGLVGVAAAAAGAAVTVSDRSAYALAFAAVNAEVNGLSVEAVRCDWRDPAPLAVRGPWDLVLGADLLYDERSAFHLLRLLDRLVAAAGEVWLTDPGRRAAAAFTAAASVDWTLSRRACGSGVVLHRLRRDPDAGRSL